VLRTGVPSTRAFIPSTLSVSVGTSPRAYAQRGRGTIGSFLRPGTRHWRDCDPRSPVDPSMARPLLDTTLSRQGRRLRHGRRRRRSAGRGAHGPQWPDNCVAFTNVTPPEGTRRGYFREDTCASPAGEPPVQFVGLAANGATLIRDPRTAPRWNNLSSVSGYPGLVTDCALAGEALWPEKTAPCSLRYAMHSAGSRRRPARSNRSPGPRRSRGGQAIAPGLAHFPGPRHRRVAAPPERRVPPAALAPVVLAQQVEIHAVLSLQDIEVGEAGVPPTLRLGRRHGTATPWDARNWRANGMSSR
jgi:hypothetical protein